jgi:hypothetical protein
MCLHYYCIEGVLGHVKLGYGAIDERYVLV